jgi:PAS domain S-box-containing protein
LSDIALRVNDALTEDEIFRLVGDGLKTVGLRSVIAILDEALERFRVVYASAARPILVAAERLFGAKGIGYEIAVGESFTLGQAVRERSAVFLGDFLPQPGLRQVRTRTVRRGLELLDATPQIAAPLVARDRALGAIVVQSSKLSEDDRIAVMAFAGQLANAIDRLRRSAEAASRERQLSIIVQINQNVSADLTNVVRGYDVVLHEIKRLVSFDRAELALIDLESNRIRISSPGATLPGETAGELSYPLSGSAVEWTAAHGQAYIAKDTAIDREFSEAASARAQQIRSYIAIPLRHRGQALGAFILKSRTPYFYAETDLALLSPIVDQMAGTLVNYRLFDQVEQGRRQLQAVLDSTSDAVIATDTAGRITLVNPAANRMFELESASVTGRLVWEALDFPDLADAFQQALRDNLDTPVGLEVPAHDDHVLFADLAPIRDTRGNALGWMAVIRDITHFKRLDALRSEAVAMAAHDLKSPLHLASGALGVMAEDAAALTRDQHEALGIAQSGLRRMRSLIDDLLDLKKIEDGFGVLKRECLLDEVLRSVVEESMALAVERGQELTLEIQDRLPVIQADADRLHQVFANLVSNAVKYTQPGGKVTVRAGINEAVVQVKVIDNGPGISPEDQAHIFERFYRTRASPLVDGTGLGLAIVKSITEQHGGNVILQSALGRGSQFVVSLPIGDG